MKFILQFKKVCIILVDQKLVYQYCDYLFLNIKKVIS